MSWKRSGNMDALFLGSHIPHWNANIPLPAWNSKHRKSLFSQKRIAQRISFDSLLSQMLLSVDLNNQPQFQTNKV